MEYEDPVGLGRLDSDRVVVVDASPPSLILFGAGGTEHRLVIPARPRHAIVAEGRLLIATIEATVYEVTLDGQVRTLNTRQDFGLRENRGSGAAAAPRLRGNHMAFTGPSAIWRLGAQPRRIIQRCVHDDLLGTLEEAVRIDTPFGPQPFNLTTTQDFLPLGAEGFLALGGLVVEGGAGQRLRSIEHYDPSGRLTQAWQLLGYPVVRGCLMNTPSAECWYGTKRSSTESNWSKLKGLSTGRLASSYPSPNSTLIPCSKTMSRGMPAESSRSRSAWSSAGTNPRSSMSCATPS